MIIEKKKKQLLKTYKFIFLDFSNCRRLGLNNWDTEYLKYRFVNQAPNVSMTNVISRGYKYRVREYLHGFLKPEQPANEAFLTRALVAKLKSDLTSDLKDLRARRRELKGYVWAGKGFVDMKETLRQAIQRGEEGVKHKRNHLRDWQGRQKELQDSGVYTYLELLM